jgi:HK97 family phage major capsid protein
LSRHTDSSTRTLLDRFQAGMRDRDERLALLEKENRDIREQLRNRGSMMRDPDAPRPETISVGRLLRHVAARTWPKRDTPEGRALYSDDAERLRAQFEARSDHGTDDDTLGGYIVPGNYLPASFIEHLNNASVVRRAGATVLDGLTGYEVRIPRLASTFTGYWGTENPSSDFTESNATFGQLVLRPHLAYALGTVSNQLLQLSTPQADAILESEMALTIGLLEDLAFLRGTGASGQPEGISSRVSSGNVGDVTCDAVPTLDMLRDMITECQKDNAPLNKTGYVMRPDMLALLQKIKVVSGNRNYVLQDFAGNPTQGIPPIIWGHPVYTTNAVPANLGAGSDETGITFGSWDQFIVAEWGGVQFAASGSAGDVFEKNQTRLRITKLVDGAPRHDQSFCHIEDARYS